MKGVPPVVGTSTKVPLDRDEMTFPIQALGDCSMCPISFWPSVGYSRHPANCKSSVVSPQCPQWLTEKQRSASSPWDVLDTAQGKKATI